MTPFFAIFDFFKRVLEIFSFWVDTVAGAVPFSLFPSSLLAISPPLLLLLLRGGVIGTPSSVISRRILVNEELSLLPCPGASAPWFASSAFRRLGCFVRACSCLRELECCLCR